MITTFIFIVWIYRYLYALQKSRYPSQPFGHPLIFDNIILSTVIFGHGCDCVVYDSKKKKPTILWPYMSFYTITRVYFRVGCRVIRLWRHFRKTIPINRDLKCRDLYRWRKKENVFSIFANLVLNCQAFFFKKSDNIYNTHKNQMKTK